MEPQPGSGQETTIHRPHPHSLFTGGPPDGQRVPESEVSFSYPIFDHGSPSDVRWRRLILAACGVVLSFDTREGGHGTRRSGLHAVVGRARAEEEVVARPGNMVPGNEAEQRAVRKVVVLLRIGGRVTQLRFRLIPRDHQRAHDERYAVDLGAQVFTL